jgi:dihydrodiol dehydrogenase / D-xylose 1-dehydrogenase (NADP)
VKVYAQGTTLPTGVDDLAVITLTYANGGIAQLSCSISYSMACDAVVCGTKGELRLPHPFWCSTRLETPESVYAGENLCKDFPLPEPHLPGNYPNPTGLRYEAEEVYSCVKGGRTESDVMPLDQTLVVAEVAEEVMRQLNVVYYRQK